MPSDLSERVENDEAMPPEARKWKRRAEAAEAELATLKSAFTENQRERFARYAEEHAKVLGLEAERDVLRGEVQYWTDAAADCAEERHALRAVHQRTVELNIMYETSNGELERERDALRVRLGTADVAVAKVAAALEFLLRFMNPDDPVEEAREGLAAASAYFSDGAP